MSGGQNYFLPTMDMAKVGLSVVKVFCTHLNIPSPLPTIYFSANFGGDSCDPMVRLGVKRERWALTATGHSRGA